MSRSNSPSAAAPSVDLQVQFETIVERLQLLLDHADYNLSSENEIRIDDLLVQLLVWGVDLDIKSGTLKWLQQECVDEAAVVESNLRLIQANLDEIPSPASIRTHRPEDFENVLNRLVSDGRNLCELSTSLKIVIGLRKKTGPVAQVREYMTAWRLESNAISPSHGKPDRIKAPKRQSSEAEQETVSQMQADSPEGKHESEPQDIGKLLRQSEKRGSRGGPFWPRSLLERIMSTDKEFLRLSARVEEDLNESLWRDYLKIYALLALVEKTDNILGFVSGGVCDHDLPLHYDKGQFFKDHLPVKCFENWRLFEMDYFDQQQRGFTVPFFELGPGYAPKHYALDNQAIVPWVNERGNSASGVPLDNVGGFGAVRCISIDPDNHGFEEPLLEMGLDATFFALKAIHGYDHGTEERFKKEVDFLRRFSGREHPHLITLLASITHDEKYYLLFPYAECDLLQFWESIHPWAPLTEIEEAQWLAKQLLGLAGALDAMHNPKNQEGKPIYGRHGDIKPSNILCFRSTDDPRGVLVLSDYGLSSLDLKASRSNVPNTMVGVTATYRAPEFDMEGGIISRAFDIWGFGCVFLEFVTWFLGGNELVQEFTDRRTTQESFSWYSDVFFDTKMVEGEEKRSFQVKSQVTDWIQKLHSHPKCTDFVHDILTLVKTKMIVVISERSNVRRVSSELLVQTFKGMYHKSD
ncbi:hypothetical protein N0V84_006488 [Fusarium piperis]|uniref:Protein kinase domain-containing protein n=1 Tax=Fusarium piperis TaxID=1435070 RepID=A0A9W8WC28_9HYPO|nr:hypothetical protein N0V84_006488 [Fusarium piperis]